MKHKFFSLLVAIAASVGMMNAAIINGTFGTTPNVFTWSLNTQDSTLTIEGSGIILSPYPWIDYRAYIKHVNLPDGLTGIGETAFMYCDNLISIEIPNSVTYIGQAAFCGCSSLSSIVIPNSVTYIGQEAFLYCTSLSSIVISNGITEIKSDVFCNCTSLTSVTIPNGVTSIGAYAFSGCTSLSSIDIPNSVTYIGYETFYGCTSLSTIDIPSSVTKIDNKAFEYCSGLTSITCKASTPPTISANTFNGVDKSIPLFVPEGTVDIYANTICWEEFTNVYVIGTNINTYRVEFRDWNDELLKVDSVMYNSAAIAPSDPYREGYTFIGWDKSFDNILSDLVVIAQYELGEDKEIFITFNDRDGYSILDNTVQLKVPAAPEISGFTFIGWRPVADIFINSIYIEAVYEADELTSAPEVYINPSNTAQKLIKNGNVYILHEDKTYTIQGQKVK